MADLRHCNHCGRDKPLTDFYLYKRGGQAGKPTSWCKECTKELVRQHRRANPEQYKISDARRNEARRAKYQARRESLLEELELLKQAQAGVCPLCQRAGVALQPDRAPKTGEVRGLLCAICNRYLSFIEKDDWGERARSYVAQAPGRIRRLLAERKRSARTPNGEG